MSKERLESKPAWLKPAVWVLLTLPALIFLFYHAKYYMPFISDDSLISLRYAQRLLEGKGLTWTDGPPVEGYSNLLWVLAVAFLGAFGVDLIDATRVLGFVGMGLVMFAVVYALAPPARGSSIVGASAANVFIAFAGPIAVWAIGGLEQPLIAGFLAWAIALMFRVLEDDEPSKAHTFGASVFLGLLALTRPDGAIFTVSAVAALVFSKGFNRRTLTIAAKIVSLPLLFYGGQLAFRLMYYGEWVPNTAYLKVTPSPEYFERGRQYALTGFLALAPLSFVGLALIILMLLSKAQRPKALLLLLALVTWLAYLVLIGGDIFPAFRHHVPVIVILAFALAAGTAHVWSGIQSKPVRGLVVVLLALLSAYFLRVQINHPQNERGRTERWEWHGKKVGEFLKEAFGHKQPLLAVTAAGCLPYWSELPSLDMIGLNDHYLARNPPPPGTKRRLGHEFGDGAYMLRRAPDLIIFCGPAGKLTACYPSGTQKEKTQEFRDRYAPVIFADVPTLSVSRRERWTVGNPPQGMLSLVYISRDSDKIGIRNEGDRVVIPGYLFTDSDNTNQDGIARELVVVAYMNGDREVVIAVTDKRPAAISGVRLPAGKWEADVTPRSDRVEATVEAQGGGRYKIVVRSTGRSPVEVKEVILTAKDRR